ncbi:MAG: MFS transporter [Alphaproteobacteria bacterium]
MMFLGFSAGLPFLLVFSTLSAWLRAEEVSRAAIGFFSWVGITYSIKVFWAPIVDRVPLPIITRVLGRRRSWMLIAMVGIALGLLGMASMNPAADLRVLALFALLVAFSSATQDISIDAYRIEAVARELQGAMAATYQLGYRIALLVAGGGALVLADATSWAFAYMVLASLTLVGIGTVLMIHEPAISTDLSQRLDGGKSWFVAAVVNPFVDFFSRNGRLALVILLFVGLFRISDLLMGVMANPFYIDLGFSLTEIGLIIKVYGTFATIIGAFVGGALVVRYGIMWPLLAGAVLLASTNLLFSALALVGPDLVMLTVTITADNLSAGLAGTVFIAYLSSLTNTAYTATQYALFTSLMTLPGKFLGGFTGLAVDSIGYVEFFIYAALAGVPAIVLVLVLMRAERNQAVRHA